MSLAKKLKEKILNGYEITYKEAQALYLEPLDEIANAANEIRKYFCGNNFDICTIINAKSGRCSEDCKFCSQSSHHNTDCEEYPLLSNEKIFSEAKNNSDAGVLRYSLVTSGKKLNDEEIDSICKTVKTIKENINIKVCGSLGLLTQNQFKKLLESGLTRVHNNLETSKEFFGKMCTTHTFKDKVQSLISAKESGMSICSGGIFGLGENSDDRISLAFSLKELDVKSIPINILNPIEGTPYQNNKVISSEEIRKIVAVFRFILPNAFIRLAGGRGLLDDKGRSCFTSGANAAITGDMLTTSGISIRTDLDMVKELGYNVCIS